MMNLSDYTIIPKFTRKELKEVKEEIVDAINKFLAIQSKTAKEVGDLYKALKYSLSKFTGRSLTFKKLAESTRPMMTHEGRSKQVKQQLSNKESTLRKAIVALMSFINTQMNNISAKHNDALKTLAQQSKTVMGKIRLIKKVAVTIADRIFHIKKEAQREKAQSLLQDMEMYNALLQLHAFLQKFVTEYTSAELLGQMLEHK